MLALILLVGLAAFIVAYIFYGRFLNRRFEIDDSRPTPSHLEYDGIDRVPAQKGILLGHHFASIAGAGPIVGPVIATVAFGWAPALIWIIIGSIFVGGVHDFSAMIASVRHNARSIAEIAKQYMSPLAWKLFLAFAWLALIYVLTVFLDLTAATFVESGGVATSSILFIILAIAFGLSIYRLKMSLLTSSLIFVPLVFAAVWLGQQIPLPADKIPAFVLGSPAKTWCVILLVYCFIASTTPVWILLQPRDYLSSFLLYASVIGGVLGILIGGFKIEYPAFKAWSDPQLGKLFPMLFIAVACGACSGFHSLVASGTSSKQINKESDAKLVGYGAMLIEGVVAIIALAAVVIVTQNADLAKTPPLIFADGLGKFFSAIGIPANLGRSFALLALSAFILTTLDTATRLSRYIFEEFFGLKNAASRYPATLATLVLPTILVLITLKDASGNPIPAWKAIWPVFGATNQLLAGLVLLIIAVWLRKTGRKTLFILLPMAFMNITTLTAIVMLLRQYKLKSAVGVIAAILLVLGLVLVFEACRTVWKTSSWGQAGGKKAG